VIYITTGAEFTRIEGMEMCGHDSLGPVINVSLLSSNLAGEVQVSDCVIKGLPNSHGIYTISKSGVAQVLKVWNILIYDSNRGIYIFGNTGGSNDAYIYNCTIYNCTYGVIQSFGDVYVYNVLAYNNSMADFLGTFAGGSNNFSKDDSAPGANSIHGDTDSKEPYFVSTTGGSEDFHILLNSDCRGNGVNDPGSGLYSDDIDRQARA